MKGLNQPHTNTHTHTHTERMAGDTKISIQTTISDFLLLGTNDCKLESCLA